MNEILLYDGIYNFTAAEFINRVESLKGQDITVRVSNGGGNVFASWGMIAKLLEHDGKVKIKVDGIAASMTAFLLIFFDDVECLDVSSFVFHRADGYQGDEESRAWLQSTNTKIRKKLEAKVDAAIWKEITGKTIDQMFSLESRIDIPLTAQQAKKLGLVKKITTLSVGEAKTIKADFMAIAASLHSPEAKLPPVIEQVIASEKTVEETIEKNQNPNHKMKNVAEFKAAHPDLFAEIHTAGVTAGQKAERDRIEAFMVYVDVDAEAVKKGIESGEAMSTKQMAELTRKSMQAEVITKTKDETSGKIATDTVSPDGTKTEKEKSLEEFEASVKSKLGLK